ncbi:MAG: hypothetical protein NT123_13050 [Proteobacteria bacterium]|nr:hypothetical protein [Pseudomonadota bacterium]
MKKLHIKITAEMDIPDDWEVVEHPAGIQVLKIGDKFVDIDIAPVATTSLEEDATWTDKDEGLINMVLEALTEMDSELTIQLRH